MNEDTTLPTQQVKQDIPQVDTARIVEETTQQLESRFEEKLAEVEQRAYERAQESITEKLVGKPKPEKWQPKSYEEIVERAKEETTKELTARQQREAQEAKKAQEEQEKARQEQMKQGFETWDKQFKELEEAGYLPKLDEGIAKKLANPSELTEEEMADPAVKLRWDIYKKAAETKEPHLGYVYFKHFQNRQSQTPPVFGSHKASSNSEPSTAFSWEDIHNTSLDEIAKQVVSE